MNALWCGAVVLIYSEDEFSMTVRPLQINYYSIIILSLSLLFLFVIQSYLLITLSPLTYL